MPTKKAIKAFVQYIQRNDTEAALSALADDPSLAHARCASPPKKYDGQSLLHIAMRNGASTIAIALIDAGSDVNLRAASMADVPFGDRLAMVQSTAARLDGRISQAAEKLEDYDLLVDSLGKCLVVATALWHPMFLCREYISAVVQSIVDANPENPFIVMNHFEFYGDATDWGFDFTERKFDFAISSDTIAVSGITVGEFLELVDRSGIF